MSSSQSTADFLVEQISSVCNPRTAGFRMKKMFGEYGVYFDGKFVGALCDDQLFVKPTVAGRAFMNSPQEAPPYPGAKPYLVVPAELWEDPERLCEVLRITADELPEKNQK